MRRPRFVAIAILVVFAAALYGQNQQLTITTSDPLPPATLGSPYFFTFTAAGGFPSYVNWRIVERTLPAEFTLNPSTGVLSGTPATAGIYMLQVFVDDSRGQFASKAFSLTVNAPPLTITTTSLPPGTVGAPYLQTLAATGGTGSYTWSVSAGLPAGLTLNQAGLLSGTPSAAGPFTFTVTVNGTVSKQFTLFVSVPAAPALSITDVPATPGQQPSFNVQLSSAYTLDISGTVTLTFAGDSGLPNDPNIVFQNGTRTLDFTIAAGSTASSASLQTGTVAGRIDLTITRLVAAGQSILPSPAPVRSIQIPRSAPVISSVQVVKTTGGFNVLVTGYSTPRQVTQAAFTFTAAAGKSLQTTQVTVPVDSAFTTWYGGTSSSQYGSTFLYTQPFQVQGDVSAIASVSVTLTNAVGTSQSGSATF